jgi:hypothetical protein
MEIYIPSFKRSNPGLITTLEFIPENWYDHTFLLIHPDELTVYKDLPWQKRLCPLKGISLVRDWACNHTSSRYVMFMDDNLIFQHYHKDVDKFVKSTREDMSEYIRLILTWLHDGIPCAGARHRFRNTEFRTKPYEELFRLCYCYGLDMEVMRENNVHFTFQEGGNFNEEHHVALSLIELGYKNRITNLTTVHKAHDKGVGGCHAAGRNAENIVQSMHAFTKIHPYSGFFKTEAPTQHEKIGYELQIRWKKSFGIKQRNRVKASNFFGRKS